MVRIGLVAVVLLLCLILVPGPFATAVSFLAAPLFEAKVWMGEMGTTIPGYLRARGSLIAEIEELRSDAEEGASLRAELMALRAAHLMIRDVDDGEDRIVADVIRTPPETPYDTLLVAAGSDEGIVQGAFVRHGRIVIGQVAQVHPKTSLIVLFSTPGVRTPVYLWGANVFAQAEGQGGSVVRVGVPQGLSLKEGDAVTLPVPGTAIMGSIDHIEADETNPEQYAFVTQEVALRGLRFVAIDREIAPSVTPADAAAAVEMIRSGVIPSPFAPILETLPAATTTVAITSAATSTP